MDGRKGRARTGLTPLLMPQGPCCAWRMRIGAKIMLSTAMDAARDGLAGLAGGGWLMSLPRREQPCCEHPAGSARPGLPRRGGGARLVAVVFGQSATAARSSVVLPVQWELVEPGDEFTILLDGDVVLAQAAGEDQPSLTLAGFCRMPGGALPADGDAGARAQLAEAARAFITSIAASLAPSVASAGEPEAGQAWAWVNGLPRS